MKKLVLTTAAVMFLALTSFAADGGKCCKKDAKKCETTSCTKDAKCKDKEKCCAKGEDMNCKKESKDCCMKKASGTTEVK